MPTPSDLQTPTFQPWAAERLAQRAKLPAPVRAGVQRLYGVQGIEGHAGLSQPYPHPDSLVKKKGISVLREIQDRDDMAASATAYLYLAVLSPGYRIDAPGEDPMEVRATDHMRQVFDDLQGTVTQTFLNTLDGCGMGFSVSEIEWAEKTLEGEWVGKQGVKRITHKSPKYIQFKTDSYGRVLDDGVWQESYRDGQVYNKVPLENIIYFVFWPRDDSPYGTPLLKPAYPHYFTKQLAIKERGAYLEAYGRPIVIGRADTSKDETKRNEYLQMLREIRSMLVSVLPEDFPIEFHEMSMRPTSAHAEAIKDANRGIARSLLLPAMVMEKDSTGSLAMAKNQSETQFVWILKYISELLRATYNEQFVKPVHEHNWGTRVARPKVAINNYVEEDLLVKANMFKALSGMGLPFAVRQLRTTFGVEEPEEDEAVIIGGAQPAPEMPGETDDLRSSYTEMVYDWAQRKIKPPREFVQIPAAVQNRLAQRELEGIEKEVDFDGALRHENAAVQLWSEIGGVTLSEIGKELEERAGKGNGARPSK